MEDTICPVITVEEIAEPVEPRRTSLFSREKGNSDFGTAVLSHADFPRPRSKSLPFAKISPGTTRKRFGKQTLYDIIKNVLEKGLKGKVFSEIDCDKQSRALASEIKSRIANLKVPNFKFVCLCHITKQFEHPAMKVESGYAWDDTKTSVYKDVFAEYLYKNNDIIAIGNVHGIFSTGFNSSNFLKVFCRNYDAKRSSITEENESEED